MRLCQNVCGKQIKQDKGPHTICYKQNDYTRQVNKHALEQTNTSPPPSSLLLLKFLAQHAGRDRAAVLWRAAVTVDDNQMKLM